MGTRSVTGGTSSRQIPDTDRFNLSLIIQSAWLKVKAVGRLFLEEGSIQSTDIKQRYILFIFVSDKYLQYCCHSFF